MRPPNEGVGSGRWTVTASGSPAARRRSDSSGRDRDRRSANLARAVRSLLHAGIRVKYLGNYLSDHGTAGVETHGALVPPPGSLGLGHLDEVTQIFPGHVRAL